jgi:PAS domain S-box-containing protein
MIKYSYRDMPKTKEVEQEEIGSVNPLIKIETAERFALSQKAAKVGTFEWTPADNLVIWSPELELLYGIERGEFSGKYQDWLKYVHAADRKILEQEMLATIKNGQPFYGEFRIIKKDGTQRWMLGRGELVKGLLGKSDRFIGANVDITDRKEVDNRLRASEQRYRAFIKNSSEGIWRMELDKPIPINLPIEQQIKMLYENARMAEANEAMAKMYGYKNIKDLIGLRWGELWIKNDPANTKFLKAFIKSGYNQSSAESREKDSKGNDKYFLNNFFGIIENGELKRLWGTQQDITESHQASEALKKSQERLSLALEGSKLGMWEWDITTGNLEWSGRLKKIFGLKASDSVTYERYLTMLHPEDLPQMQEVIKHSLKTGHNYQMEHRIIRPDGSIHWLLGQGKTFIQKGKPVRMIGTSIDIDERKKAEQLRVKMASLSSERRDLIEINRTKDEFIALTSHQLRTPATGVKQYLGLLLENYSDPLTEGQRTFIEKAYENNERQLRIVDELLRVAQLDLDKVRLHVRDTDLCKLVNEEVGSLKGKFNKRRQKIEVICAQKPFIARFDRGQLRMAVDNLLENASNYSPEGKKITVSLEKDDSGVKISVKDRGVGIAKKDFPKLFQKFSRVYNSLSDSVNGTGLGLYYAQKIIELHGGTITVSSQLNKGTTFTITLPA